MMKYCKILLLLLSGVNTLCAAPQLIIRTDRDDAVYKCGEMITFRIRCADNGKALVNTGIEWQISGDVTANRSGTAVTDQNGECEVKTVLDRPGFLMCRISVNGKVERCGAGIEPEKIRPSRTRPADMERFWDNIIAGSKALPLEVFRKEVPVPEPFREKIKAWDVTVNSTSSMPVRGALAMPVGAKKGSLPLIISFHGAGVHAANIMARWASEGRIALDVNAHGIENFKPAEYYQSLDKGTLKSYRYDNCKSRETIYFNGMFRRVIRALEYAKTIPEWDGKNLIVWGGSQGGGQALAAAAFDPDVTICVALVPALCDHGGFFAGRESGWPRFHWNKEGRTPEAQTAADYVDAALLAPRIKAACFVSTGFVDLSCNPASVYAMYNFLGTKNKEIVNDIHSPHTVPRETYLKAYKFINKNLKNKGN